MKISVVIPMYNESAIIKNTALYLSEYMQNNFDSYEIIFSDDGSSDKSAEIVRSLAIDNICVVESKENHGKGSAVRAGVNKAAGDIILFTDADLAYGTEVIGRAYEVISQSDCGVLIGSRNIEKGSYGEYPRTREIFSKIYAIQLAMVKVADAHINMSDQKYAFSREIISKPVSTKRSIAPIRVKS